MSKLWNYVKNLFQEAASSSSQQPLIHELIERSEAEKAAYERWKNTLVCRQLCKWLHQEYTSYLNNPEEADEAIYFLETPSAKGFVIYFRNTQYSRQDCLFLMDYLKERVLSLQYRTYVSDTRTYPNDKWVENIQRHYLKPPPQVPQSNGQQLAQAYGNITIELLIRNDQVWNLKFSAISHHGRAYQNAEEFKDLMAELVQ